MEINYKRPEVLSSQKIVMFEGTIDDKIFYITAILDDWDGWSVEQIDWDKAENYNEAIESEIMVKFLDEIGEYDI